MLVYMTRAIEATRTLEYLSESQNATPGDKTVRLARDACFTAPAVLLAPPVN